MKINKREARLGSINPNPHPFLDHGIPDPLSSGTPPQWKSAFILEKTRLVQGGLTNLCLPSRGVDSREESVNSSLPCVLSFPPSGLEGWGGGFPVPSTKARGSNSNLSYQSKPSSGYLVFRSSAASVQAGWDGYKLDWLLKRKARGKIRHLWVPD